MSDITIERNVHAPAGISFFEKYLTVWVTLCIVAGIALGHLLPGLFGAIAAAEIARVNLPVAVLIWLMIVPMLLRVDFASLAKVGTYWRGIGVTLFVNWAVKPFSMALLAWLFIGWLFRPWLPEAQIDSYIAGLIILAAAPCTAMVFVWSNLTRGEPNFTLSQVALNDAIMIVAFAPIVGLLLGLSAITVPWDTLLISVVLYILLPVIAATLRSAAADLELMKVEELGVLAQAIFARIASVDGETRGVFSSEAAGEYSTFVGREVRVEEIQPVANELLAANLIIRRGHGLYGVTDPFVQEIWRERQAMLGKR